MRVEHTNEATKGEFVPIEITMTIESEEELQNLWHRLNVTYNNIEEGSSGKILGGDGDSWPLWNLLDDIAGERDINLTT